MNLGRFLGTALSTFFSGAYIQVYGYKTLWFLIFFISIISGILMFVLKIFSVKSELDNYTESKIKSAV
nr:hypothetical protein [Clostridium beijerinckii]